MSEKPVREYDKFMLRFPDGMRDVIAERAKRNGRSMNSEIISILENALNESISDYDKDEILEVIKIQSDLLKKYSETVQKNTKTIQEITKALKENKKI